MVTSVSLAINMANIKPICDYFVKNQLYLILFLPQLIFFIRNSTCLSLRQMDRHSEKKKVDILEAMLKLFTKKNKKTLHVPEVRLELYYTEDAQDFR